MLILVAAQPGAAATARAMVAARLSREAGQTFAWTDSVAGGKVAPSQLVVYPAGSLDLRLDLTVEAKEKVEADDELILTFREVFSGKALTRKLPAKAALAPGTKADWQVRLTGRDLGLGAGAYHLLVDLAREGRSLTAGRVGSLFFLVARPTDSLRYVTANYQMAFLSFLLDPETGGALQFVPKPPLLPPTLDPHNPATRQQWLDAFGQLALKRKGVHKHHVRTDRKARIVAELVADGGQGILFAMMAYRAMGDKVKEQYAHRTLDRFMVRRLFDHHLVRLGNWQQDSHLVKVIAQACILLHNDPEHGKWAEATFASLEKWAPQAANRTKLTHYCAEDPGVYTGRILAGKAFFQIAHWLFRGKPHPGPVGTVDQLVRFAAQESDFLAEHKGHYINRGEDWLKKCSNVNIACGLAGALHLARQSGQKEVASKIAAALRLAMHAAKTYKSRPGRWMQADAYTLCTTALRLIGDDADIRAYRRDCDPGGDFVPVGAHRFNSLGALILSTPEYRAALKNGASEWRLLVDLPKYNRP